jgi:hypothetical protein
MLSGHYFFLSLFITGIQAFFNAAIMLSAWHDWRKYGKLSSIPLLGAGLIAFLAFGLSLILLISRLSSVGVSFLLIPVWAWSQWTIYHEKKWAWYAFLFCCLFILGYVEFAANMNLSRPLDEWPAYYFIWVFCLATDAIALILLH